MNTNEKILTFEYLVTSLLKWQGNGIINKKNDFSILKTLKLLFFVSAVGTDSKSVDTLLDNVFNKFLAMTYGHVEEDIYSEYKKEDGVFTNLIINKNSTTVKCEFFDYEISKNIKFKVDKAIEQLKQNNENIVNLKTFDLVDLSHEYFSWKYFYSKARKRGDYKENIPIEIIKNEQKFFNLN